MLKPATLWNHSPLEGESQIAERVFAPALMRWGSEIRVLSGDNFTGGSTLPPEFITLARHVPLAHRLPLTGGSGLNRPTRDFSAAPAKATSFYSDLCFNPE